MVMTYLEAVDYVRNYYSVSIRDARQTLALARVGNQVFCGQHTLYYRSDKKYELIDEGEI